MKLCSQPLPHAILLVLLAFLCSCQNGRDENSVTVSFHVVVPGTLAPLDLPYIASSRNGWEASSIRWKMKETAPHEYSLDIQLPIGMQLEYKYTLGTSLCYEGQRDNTYRPNRILTVQPNHIQYDTVADWEMESITAGRWLPEDVGKLQLVWLNERLDLTGVDKMSADNRVKQLKTIPELDSLLKGVQEEWRKVSETTYQGVLPEIQSPYYINILLPLTDTNLVAAAREYVFEYYRVPAFFKEYKEIRNLPFAKMARRLDMAIFTLQDVDDAYWLGLGDTLKSKEVVYQQQRRLQLMDQWAEFSKIFLAVPALIDSVMPTLSPSDDNQKARFYGAKLFLENKLLCWPVLDALARGETERALVEFEKLRAFGPEGIGGPPYWKMAYMMRENLKRKGYRREALDVTDSLFLNCAREGPIDDQKENFKNQYVRVDSVRGLARYTAMLQRIENGGTLQFITAKDKKPFLSGKFLDATSGKFVDLASYRGKIVIIDFWSTVCIPCLAELADVQRHAEEFSSRSDIAFLSVLSHPNFVGEKGLKRFIDSHGLTYPVLVETNDLATLRFNILAFPTKVVLNRRGEVDGSWEGGGNWEKVNERVAMLRENR